MLRIHHPRILLALLLVMGLIGGTVAVIANDQDPYGAPVSLPIPTPLPLDEAEKQDAIAVLRQSGVVDQVAGAQPWTASDFYRRPIGRITGVYLIAKPGSSRLNTRVPGGSRNVPRNPSNRVSGDLDRHYPTSCHRRRREQRGCPLRPL